MFTKNSEKMPSPQKNPKRCILILLVCVSGLRDKKLKTHKPSHKHNHHTNSQIQNHQPSYFPKKARTMKAITGRKLYWRAAFLFSGLGLIAVALIPGDKLTFVSSYQWIELLIPLLVFVLEWMLSLIYQCMDFFPSCVPALLTCMQYHYLQGAASNGKKFILHTPPSLSSDQGSRALSINLGGGDCLWLPPVYDVPAEIDFHKTIIAGYPSGDKRMIFIQMDALTGWRKFTCQCDTLYKCWLCHLISALSILTTLAICWLTREAAKDEWDFEYLGTSNHPFVKANYPHHEGIWGWGDVADQVVMMVCNIRRSMVECKWTNGFRFMILTSIDFWSNRGTRSF